MDEPTTVRFEAFFEALWGRPPFAWQSALARRVLTRSDKPWPDAIALPTAAGKTACIDIAVFALATQASRLDAGEAVTAPRRIFFVVDRRVIVDEAFERARRLAQRLRDARDGVLGQVAGSLRRLAGDLPGHTPQAEPLAVFELRGGMYRSEDWARSPLQPTVVASTVDQLGSRLLFRAYGRGPGMWPVYAGLAGNDSLILLDEAHCAQPFLETLQAVARYRGWAERPLPPRFHPVVMSATPPAGLTDLFRDESSEPQQPDHPLGRRQLAAKPARLVLTKAKGKNATRQLAGELFKAANELVSLERRAVVVFVNRVATARALFRLMHERHGEHAILLTGRMRPIDKDDTVLERLAVLSAEESSSRQLAEPMFVVATQTLEVGANLDFDALVTECASLDALRQRFGRLNRMGRPIEARAAILVRADQAANSDDDPVYGPALSATWNWLTAAAGDTAEVDFAIARLAGQLPEGEALVRLNAPSLSAPVMLPAHLDCWGQTDPEPAPSPEVALFLHSPRKATADVQVCWRADVELTSATGVQAALDLLALCPPAAAECVPVPVGQFQRWLEQEEGEDPTADVEGEEPPEVGEKSREPERAPHQVLLWLGRKQQDRQVLIDDATQVRPGDVIVIPATAGDWRGLADLAQGPGTEPVLDWGDRAYRQIRARAFLRLNPGVVNGWPESPARQALLDIATQAYDRYEEDPDELGHELKHALSLLAEQAMPPGWQWLAETAGALASDHRLRHGIALHPSGGLIVRGSQRLPRHSGSTDPFSDEDDASASGTVRVSLLDQHLPGVAGLAGRFAAGCGLPDAMIRALELAGRLHDLGKADPRFQALLAGGTLWTRGELLAKSGDLPQGWHAYERARNAAGYPKGGRHELLSVRLAESAPDLLPEDTQLRDLVLHLIASHHGHCRAFAPVVEDGQPITVELEMQDRRLMHSSETGLERLDSGVAERFWRLTRRYGWWGLAWLEAILRLADHRQSEAETHERSENR